MDNNTLSLEFTGSKAVIDSIASDIAKRLDKPTNQRPFNVETSEMAKRLLANNPSKRYTDNYLASETKAMDETEVVEVNMSDTTKIDSELETFSDPPKQPSSPISDDSRFA
jgi:RNA polymerase subunit RPABC4/transcription elongation factor Spt4